MAADSAAMRHFRANVLRMLHATEGMSISWLARALNESRNGQTDQKAVSRPFLSNLLNGHFACSIPFAEDIAAVLGVPLTDLLKPPPKKVRQTA